MSVLRVKHLAPGTFDRVLRRYGIEPVGVAPAEHIPGSYWGEPEAGLIGRRLFLREDTPIHSVMHEAAHFVCMPPAHRAVLDRDAGGDYDEENGVCYLQILLADAIDGVGRVRMMQDMDEWGYTFRLGSAAAWFARDADEARRWLLDRALIDASGDPTWRLRGVDLADAATRVAALAAR